MESELYAIISLLAAPGRPSGHILMRVDCTGKHITLPIMRDMRSPYAKPVYLSVRDGHLYALQVVDSNVTLYEIVADEITVVDCIGSTVRWPHIYTNEWPMYIDSDNLAAEYKINGERYTYIAAVDWSGSRPRLVTHYPHCTKNVKFMRYVSDLSVPGKRYALYARTSTSYIDDMVAMIGNDHVVVPYIIPTDGGDLCMEEPALSMSYAYVIADVLHLRYCNYKITLDLVTRKAFAEHITPTNQIDGNEHRSIICERLLVHLRIISGDLCGYRLAVHDIATGDKYDLDPMLSRAPDYIVTLLRAPIEWANI